MTFVFGNMWDLSAPTKDGREPASPVLDHQEAPTLGLRLIFVHLWSVLLLADVKQATMPRTAHITEMILRLELCPDSEHFRNP